MSERLPATTENATEIARLATGLGTALAAIWFPPAALAQPVIDRLIERYVRRPERLLLERLRAGDVQALTDDQMFEFVPMTTKLFQAAREGEYEHNLRLLSEYLANEIKQPQPDAGKFVKVARRVEGMSERELTVIALTDAACRRMDANPPPEAYQVGRAFVAATDLAQENGGAHGLDARQVGEALNDLAGRGLLVPDGATRAGKEEEYYHRTDDFLDLIARAHALIREPAPAADQTSAEAGESETV